MFGIDPLTISTMLVLTGNTLTCPARKPTEIHVKPRTAEVIYDRTHTLEQLQNYETDTVDPYGFHGKTVTQGFMKGEIELRHKIKFGTAKYDRHGYGCVWYDSIDIELNIDPRIFIAKELYSDRCMRNAIIEHELKHVRVDREIVNKYANSMGKNVYNALKSRGFSVGPLPVERMDEVRSKMQRVVQQVLELEYKKLGIERQERQRAVDSLEEYERVDALCPNFEKRKTNLYRRIFND